ncbi:beta-phosphoglucomutase [Altibacter sp. HG106]|uniref:beta-phosphoglucomutase n=1 Tax=Altibacter sp. HG106 TaxID=3023937 RepID=UPI0023509FAE|nr:beta-phosphoglucomutase [Altibacter sp. HG106]MDC7995450.1 beta-phosphoglucomutase [Altibacter sp. HG106]
MSTKGFIFDLDGVIVDTAKYHYLAWQQLAQELGISFTETQNEELKGVSRVRSLEKILAWGGVSLTEEEFNRQLQKKNKEYLTYIETMSEDELLPDVKRVLYFLKEQQQPLALGSASKNARLILHKTGLFELFDAIVDGTNVTKAKPSPEVFMVAAEQLGMAPENCIVFEDSLAGIQAANTAKMMSIGVGNSNILQQANRVIATFTELPNPELEALIHH